MHVQDGRMAAVEHAVAFLADYTDVGGGHFLAHRFAQEAWPQLALLLHRGPNTALGSDDGGPAPAVVQRTRSAVLTCLLRCVQAFECVSHASQYPFSLTACITSAVEEAGPAESSHWYMVHESAHPEDIPNLKPYTCDKTPGRTQAMPATRLCQCHILL